MTNNFNVMEAIWQTSEKGPDGFLHYPPEFMDMLWDNGFIDTSRHSKANWHAAIASFKQADGTYRFNQETFLSLDSYRYKGKIRVPFNPLLINEGKYTDEGFEQLFRDSIAPSVSLEASTMQTWLEDLKKEFRQPDDLILIKAPAKLKIKKLLDENASPLRRLEILYDDYLQHDATPEAIQETQRKVTRDVSPEELARFQASTFTTSATSLAESQAEKLKHLAKTQTAKADIIAPTTPAEELKKMSRSKKGVRG